MNLQLQRIGLIFFSICLMRCVALAQVVRKRSWLEPA